MEKQIFFSKIKKGESSALMASADGQLASRQNYTVHIGHCDEAVLNTRFGLQFTFKPSQVSLCQSAWERHTGDCPINRGLPAATNKQRSLRVRGDWDRRKTRHSVPHRNLRDTASISLGEELWADTP